MPFPVADYQEDFPNSIDEFDDLLGQAQKLELDGDYCKKKTDEPPQESDSSTTAGQPQKQNDEEQAYANRRHAYWKAGRFLLRHTDLLVVVWDCVDDPTSVGTAGVVAQGLREQMPVIRIRSFAPHTVEFYDYGQTDQQPWQELTDQHLTDALTRLFSLNASQKPETASTLEPEKSKPHKPIHQTYFPHDQPRHTLITLSYRFFFALFGKHGKHKFSGLSNSYAQGSNAQWQTVEQALAALANSSEAFIADELNGGLRNHFLWADQLATYYADEYRGTYTWMFSMASLAVLFALLSGEFGIYRGLGDRVAEFLPWLAVGELLAIITILVLWWRCHHLQFHERWLDFRLLAELLRHKIMLLPIGGISRLAMPGYETANDKSLSWVNWLVRAINRAEGLPHVADGGLSADYRRGYQGYLVTLINDQIQYHQNNSERNDNIANVLRFFDIGLMVLIIAAVVFHIVDHGLGLHTGWADLSVILAAALPAFGATAHGLFSHGEYQRIAERSKGMTYQLKRIVEKLSPPQEGGQPAGQDFQATPILIQPARPEQEQATAARPEPVEGHSENPPNQPSAAHLENLANQAIETMSQELSDWRIIFRAKPLHLEL